MRLVALFALCAMLVACGGGSDDPPARTLTSITVTPAAPSVAKGLTTQFSATGTYSDASTAALSSGISWTSSAPATATVDTAGLARGVAEGAVNITATSGTVSGSTALQVTPAVLQSIAVTPNPPMSGIGITVPLTATATYSDASRVVLTNGVTWTSSATSVASVHSSTGVTTGLDIGTATITAASGSMTGTATLTVAAPGWHPAASAPVAIYWHTATSLTSGKVLVVGGYDGQTVRAIAQTYDAVTDAWSAAGNLATGRSLHTATRLADGRVLVVGGTNTSGVLATAEIYDPTTNAWSAAGQLATLRENHTATLLANGQVLVVGGDSVPAGGPALASAELYDPASNTWSAAASLVNARIYHTASVLPDGQVLVAGGWRPRTGGLLGPPEVFFADTELYDPATNTWSAGGSLAVGRSQHTATSLIDGRILVVGGSAGGAAFASTEVYDPVTDTWSAAANLATARLYHTATILGNGKVLVAAGLNVNPVNTAELYDPATNLWSATPNLGTARFRHSAALLPSGAVLVVGGSNSSTALSSSEQYR